MLGFYFAQNTHIFIPTLHMVGEKAQPRHKRSRFALWLALAVRWGFASAALPLASDKALLQSSHSASMQCPTVLNNCTATGLIQTYFSSHPHAFFAISDVVKKTLQVHGVYQQVLSPSTVLGKHYEKLHLFIDSTSVCTYKNYILKIQSFPSLRIASDR